MILNFIFKFVCISIWTLVGVISAIWTQYELDELYTDKICSDVLVEFKILASSLLSCLAYTTSASSFIYHRQSKICYGIEQGYQLDDFTTTLEGAKLYVKAPEEARSCSYGDFVHESCYVIFGGRIPWSDNMDDCKQFSRSLADINTAEENDKLFHWLLNRYKMQGITRTFFWLGAKYDNGWVWSDGTPVDLEYWPKGRQYESEGVCMVLVLDIEASTSKWEPMSCEEPAKALCEHDPI